MARKASQKDKTVRGTSSQAVVNKAGHDDTDVMSQCVNLCQAQRWREALLLCRRTCEKARNRQESDVYAGLMAAQAKIDRSLRRQMAAALIDKAAELLQKEYLLDVSE